MRLGYLIDRGFPVLPRIWKSQVSTGGFLDAIPELVRRLPGRGSLAELASFSWASAEVNVFLQPVRKGSMPGDQQNALGQAVVDHPAARSDADKIPRTLMTVGSRPGYV